MYWWVGFVLFFIGNVMNFISFGFAAQSLLAGLGSVQFISNVVCSVLFMNQRFTTRIFCSTLLIITGNLLIVVFASHDSQKLSVNELWDNFHYSAYRIYMTILLFSVVVLYIFYKEAKKRMRASLLAGERPSVLLSRLLPCAYAAISGIIGTQSVLLAKSCSELVRTTIAGENQFIYPFTYVVLVAWVASMVFWLYRMNAALRKFDGVFIIPVLQVVWTLFSIVGGGIYFREFDNFDSVTIGLFTLGVLVVIFGVYLLAPQSPSSASSNRQQLSSLDHSSDIELIAHHHPNNQVNMNHPHHNLRRYIANSSSSPLHHHTVYSDVSSTNSPAIGPSPNNNTTGFIPSSSASAASLASQSIPLGHSSSAISGSQYYPPPHHHHQHHPPHYYAHVIASLSSPSSSHSLSLSGSGSGSHPSSATSHLLHVEEERHRSSAGNTANISTTAAHNNNNNNNNLNVGWSRFASSPHYYPNPLRNLNAYDDLDDVLDTTRATPTATPTATAAPLADAAPIEVLLRQGPSNVNANASSSSASSSSSSLSFERETSSIPREVLVSDQRSRSGSSHSVLLHTGSGTFEHDDSFAITLSPAPHSMPVTPIHSGLTLARELEKRSRGMSLGFSMPMIDLGTEDL